MGQHRPRIAIVGGGIMGCTTALALADRGVDVVVLERAVPGAEASSSAAGILGAQVELHGKDSALEGFVRARDGYGAWARELRESTGIDVGHRVSGVLRVARETVTIDHLSQGRLVLGVGLGSNVFGELSAFGTPLEDRTRAEMLDEGLEILTRLWRGEPFSFAGKYYKVNDAIFLPTPVQSPRIPIWVAATWPRSRPLRRAAKWDGVCPIGGNIAAHRRNSRAIPVGVNRTDQESGNAAGR